MSIDRESSFPTSGVTGITHHKVFEHKGDWYSLTVAFRRPPDLERQPKLKRTIEQLFSSPQLQHDDRALELIRQIDNHSTRIDGAQSVAATEPPFAAASPVVDLYQHYLESHQTQLIPRIEEIIRLLGGELTIETLPA